MKQERRSLANRVTRKMNGIVPQIPHHIGTGRNIGNLQRGRYLGNKISGTPAAMVKGGRQQAGWTKERCNKGKAARQQVNLAAKARRAKVSGSLKRKSRLSCSSLSRTTQKRLTKKKKKKKKISEGHRSKHAPLLELSCLQPSLKLY